MFNNVMIREGMKVRLKRGDRLDFGLPPTPDNCDRVAHTSGGDVAVGEVGEVVPWFGLLAVVWEGRVPRRRILGVPSEGGPVDASMYEVVGAPDPEPRSARPPETTDLLERNVCL